MTPTQTKAENVEIIFFYKAQIYFMLIQLGSNTLKISDL